jgi:hypothetical protein
MDNQQEIQWFSGFFEGEGCFTIRLRKCRGNKEGYNLEPKISISTTNDKAKDICKRVLTQWFIEPSISIDRRKGKIPCYSIEISSHHSILEFTNKILPYLECDRERCVLMNKFCKSRWNRKRCSDINQHEWELYSKIQQWRSSETIREESYSSSLYWLAGIYEAEGSFYYPSIQLCNTNTGIIHKANDIIQDVLQLGSHLKRFETGNPNHQPYWVLSLHGKNKCQDFALEMQKYFKIRQGELEKIKIESGL